MDLDIATKSILGIFFLYLVMFGSYINVLLNCGLQRLLLNNIYLRHLIVYFSIFIFTFVLNWYTPKSLVLTEDFTSMKELNKFIEKYGYISSSIFYTTLIYFFFIISTKQEAIFMYAFLVLLIGVIGIYILYRIELQDVGVDYSKLINNLFITTDDISSKSKSKDKTKINTSTNLHNLVSAGYLALIINTVLGFYFYFKRQYKDHSHHWNWATFFLGTNKCKDT